MSLYGGVLLGMRMNSSSPTSPSSSTTSADDESQTTKSLRGEDDTTMDFNARVQAEVERRLGNLGEVVPANNANHDSSNSVVSKNNKKDDNGQHPRRFPKTISKFATGASLITKNDFLANFDYGIPKPPSKRDNESDPGKDDVLLLYGSTKALPDINTGTVYTDENGDTDDTSLPHFSAVDATKNCGGLNVIFTDTHGGLEQCTAIVGNYESYHIQRWLRIKPQGGSGLDVTLPLTPVGRGLQTNGQDKFSSPSDLDALQNQALLETYFDRLGDTIAALKPMAEACAGSDNTVIVMVCNTGQSDLLINFICSAQARGFGDIVKEKVLVFATDEGMLKIAQGLGLRTFYDEKIFEKMPEKEAGRYGDRAFTQMMYAKVVTVQLINRLGHDVLFQDVDLVWYKNPIPFFHDRSNPLYDFDILFQDDGARSLRYAPYSANTGFYYVRNNDKTKFLFRSLLYMGDMVISMTSHQQALAALLDEHSSLTGLRVKTMSGVDFPGGYHYHRKKEIPFLKDIVQGKHVPYLMHMSWTTNKKNKLLFFQQMGLWYTKKECENGGGVDVANGLSGEGGLETACCSAEPLVTCHFKDKPSVEQCKGSGALIDRTGKSFW
eukprot:CAMPEP_0201880180 /NCGR_PEP_ID=MMETSP0902-20130614/10855_1 /ASSEMBLY_ACC=CAM_ASM_000551 /TAXON_ID=420261 /ORGANISM="Thalassiosira antarctica, Strain CCMP982" /LENGTH=607 /DNA_ID=CAMNT_0048408159 /DNA_START=243 /DNA_END=2066 /DNA_ORIENTATION=+